MPSFQAALPGKPDQMSPIRAAVPNSQQPAADVAARRRIVEEAVHSSELEGLAVSSETLQDAEEYINGEIDAHELVTRTRARHGLD